MIGSVGDGLISGGDGDDNNVEDGNDGSGNNDDINGDAAIDNDDVVGIIDCDVICGDADGGINDDGNDDAFGGDGKLGNDNVVICSVFGQSGFTNLLLQRPRHSSLE